MKDKTKFEHEHDFVYPGKYLESNWIKPTSGKQQKDALKGHNGKDKNSYHLSKMLMKVIIQMLVEINSKFLIKDLKAAQ